MEREFGDLVKVGVFDTPKEWSINNPIKVITSGELTPSREAVIDISDYNNVPTALICTEPNSVLRLKSSTGKRDFTGIIITPGKIVIESKMTINGIVIAGNEKQGGTTEDIRKGENAGIKIEAGSNVVKFKYDIKEEKDRNMILDIKFMDKSLQRKLYDCLGMTNYRSAPAPIESPSNHNERVEAIFGPSGKRKVKLSNESVISSNQEGLQFKMKSLKKIKN